MGAGTGLLFILRWFWWRINAYSEIAAMVISFLVAVVFKFIIPGHFPNHIELLLGVGITTFGWVLVTFLTPAVEHDRLVHFYQLIKPHSTGWQPVLEKGLAEGDIDQAAITTGQLPRELMAMFSGIFLVYGVLFSTGFWLYGNIPYALLGTLISIVAALVFRQAFRKSN
jgi:hypothetical protein